VEERKVVALDAALPAVAETEPQQGRDKRRSGAYSAVFAELLLHTELDLEMMLAHDIASIGEAGSIRIDQVRLGLRRLGMRRLCGRADLRVDMSRQIKHGDKGGSSKDADTGL
jgi:hypothetical protein